MDRRSLRVGGAASIAALALVAAGCGTSSNPVSSSTTTTTTTTPAPGGGANSAAFQAFQSCLAQHGVKSFTPGAGRPGAGGANRTPAQQQAFTACRSKLPTGGFRGGGGGGGGGAGRGGNASNPAFAKYTACLKQHGVTLGATNSPTAFAKASTACAKYRPAAGGSTTQ
jgi:hypothetical protein